MIFLIISLIVSAQVLGRNRNKQIKEKYWSSFFSSLMSRYYLNAVDQLQVAQISDSNKSLKMERI